MNPDSLPIASARFPISHADLRRFGKTITVRDEPAFLAALNELVRECLAVAADRLGSQSAALRAADAWTPPATAIQRGRAVQVDEFERPHNLSIPEFARLAGKSRQQIYKDLAARRLLAITLGARRQRLPDWQLQAPALELTRAVVAAAPGVDAWTLYLVLGEPHAALQGRSPVAAVTPGSVERIAGLVLDGLGLHA